MSRLPVALLFAVLAAASGAQAAGVVADAWSHGATAVATIGVYSVFKVGVLAALSFFMWVRNPSQRPARRPLAIGSCVLALASVAALEPPSVSAAATWAVAGDALAAIAYVWLLASILTLGRCFGVLPEARGLVTSGPYRIVRHPVYLGELGACAGLVLAAPTARNLVAAILFVVAQSVRMRLEEETLLEAFPAYREYAAETPRLIPALGGRSAFVLRVDDRLT